MKTCLIGTISFGNVVIDTYSEKPKKDTLRIWWIPQIPMDNCFYINVKDFVEARKLLGVLANYDDYQFKNNIKPDYSNVGGLQFFDGEEWLEWECIVCGEDIDHCECEKEEAKNV